MNTSSLFLMLATISGGFSLGLLMTTNYIDSKSLDKLAEQTVAQGFILTTVLVFLSAGFQLLGR